MLTWLTRLSAPIRWLIYVLLAVIVVIALALGVDRLGGFDESLQLGHFHFDVGTQSSAATGSTRPPGSSGTSGAVGSTVIGHGHGHHAHEDQGNGNHGHGRQGHGDQGD